MITIVVLTHNRAHLLRRCVEDVLLRTSTKTRQIVIWDNASSDGTRAYLEGVSDPRIEVVWSAENVGMNAYRLAFARATGDYVIELDDDVIEAPPGWDQTLLDAYGRIPRIGYLSASLRDDPNDSASQYIKYLREERRAYTREEVDDLVLLEGPTGGSCTITSRQLYEQAGGFPRNDKLTYWREDAAYVKAIKRLGYRAGVLEGLEVWHAGGPYYSKPAQTKNALYEQERRIERRKDAVKRLLLAVPFAAGLNARFAWFDPPHTYVPPRFENR